jgi:hypothetical protein
VRTIFFKKKLFLCGKGDCPYPGGVTGNAIGISGWKAAPYRECADFHAFLKERIYGGTDMNCTAPTRTRSFLGSPAGGGQDLG